MPVEAARAYPFPILEESSASEMTSRLLKDHELVYTYLAMFQHRAHSAYFPNMPNESSRSEFERFLVEAEANAVKFPDMLAVIFATMAVGLQVSLWNDSDGRWEADAVYKARMCGDVYGK